MLSWGGKAKPYTTSRFIIYVWLNLTLIVSYIIWSLCIFYSASFYCCFKNRSFLIFFKIFGAELNRITTDAYEDENDGGIVWKLSWARWDALFDQFVLLTDLVKVSRLFNFICFTKLVLTIHLEKLVGCPISPRFIHLNSNANWVLFETYPLTLEHCSSSYAFHARGL